jgi:hypothetical protein
MRKLLLSSFVVMMLLVALLVQACDPITPGAQTGSPQQKTSTSSSTSKSLSQYEKAPQWIALANAYVHVSNYTAIVSPQIYQHLDAKTISQVLQALEHYNALQISKRNAGVTIPLSFTVATPTPNANNCPPVTATSNWWGVTVFLNHCVIRVIAAGGSLLGIAGGVAAALDAFGIGLAITVVVGILTAYSAALAADDMQCGDQGAYLNVPWVPIPWAASVC